MYNDHAYTNKYNYVRVLSGPNRMLVWFFTIYLTEIVLKVALSTKALSLFKHIRYKPVTTTAGDFDSCTCLIYTVTVYMQVYAGISIKENRKGNQEWTI